MSAFKGKLHETEKLLNCLALRDELSQGIEKIYAYTRLQRDTDNADQNFQELVGIAENITADYYNANKPANFNGGTTSPAIGKFKSEAFYDSLKLEKGMYNNFSVDHFCRFSFPQEVCTLLVELLSKVVIIGLPVL